MDDKNGQRVDEVLYLLVPLSKRRKIGDASDDDGTRRPVPDQACWSLASWIDRSERDTNNLGAEMDDWEPALMTFEAQSYGVALGLQVHGIAIDVESGIAMLTPDLEYWERLDMYKVRLASARETGYGWRDREKAKKAVRMQSKLGSGIPKRVMLLDMTPGLATEGFREIVGYVQFPL